MADVSFSFTGDISDLRRALSGIKSEVEQTKQAVGSVATQITVAFAAIAGAVATVKGAFAAVAGISTAAADMEQTGLALRVMLKDAHKAAEYMAALRTYAAETPFEFQDISDAAKVLLSMGTAAGKSVEVIKKLGDVASVSGKPLKDLAFIYAKAQNSGLTNEVAEQFELQGVPIRKLLAELKGISFQDVFAGISQRQFNIDDVDAVLEKITGPGGLLESMTQLQSKTFSGVLSTLTDNIGNLGVELGTPINAAILPILNDIITAVDSLTPAVQELGRCIGAAFSAAGTIITPIVGILTDVDGAFSGLKMTAAAVAAGLLLYTGRSQEAAAASTAISARLTALTASFSQLNFASVASAFTGALSRMGAAATSTFASIRAAMTFQGAQAAMTSTLAGISALLQTTLRGLNASVNASLAGMRAALVTTLAGMRVAWSITWSTMAAVARAACITIKGALASTGVGLIFVAIGEAVAALYSWFMRMGDAAEQAAASMKAFKEVEKALKEESDSVTTDDGKKAFQRNLQGHIERIEDERKTAEDDGNDDLARELTRQLGVLKELRKESEKKLDAQIESARQAEREAAAIRTQGEEIEKLQKKLEQAREKMGNLVAQQAAKEREDYLSKLSVPQQIELRLADVGYSSLDALKAAMDAMEQRVIHDPADVETYAKLVETYNKILKLQDEHAKKQKESAEKEAKKNKETEESQATYNRKLAMLQAEIAGDEKRLQLLKQEQRLAELTAEYRKQGLADAEAAARRMVLAEIDAAEARKRKEEEKKQKKQVERMAATWIQSLKAAVGGGGRSYLVGGDAMLAESKKQTTVMTQVRDQIAKQNTTPLKVEVVPIIGN